MSTGDTYNADRVGSFTPKMEDRDALGTGEVGYVIAGIKDIFGAPVGDTLTLTKTPCAAEPLPDFKQVQPRVFAGMFPIQSDDYENFREALQKLRLNDAALHFEPETSAALGFGFRCGFLGMLHMEIVQERLEREYDLELITTAPTVVFEVVDNSGEVSLRRQSVEAAADQRDRRAARADHHGQYPGAGRPCRFRHQALCIEKRGVQNTCAISAARYRSSTKCRSPKSCSTFSIG